MSTEYCGVSGFGAKLPWFYSLDHDTMHEDPEDLEHMKKLIAMVPELQAKYDIKVSEGRIDPNSFDSIVEIADVLTDDNFGNHGPATMLAYVITKVEDIHIEAHADDEGDIYLVYSAGYPWNITEKERDLTPAALTTILEKYIDIIYDHYMYDVDYCTIVIYS